MLENTVDTSEILQQNDTRSKVKTETSSKDTMNDSEGENKGREISEEQDLPIKEGQKSGKDKDDSKKKRQKQGREKGKRLTFKEMKERAVKKRLERKFRGAKKEQLNNLTAARLASYGLAKKKKKKS